MGRNLKFDADKVVTQAQRVFWKQGYDETRIEDLLEATGLHKGSFYRSFKSKENLFLLALKSYASVTRKNFIVAEDPREYLKKFFSQMADDCVKKNRGCFIINSCVELGANKNILAKISKNYFEEIKSNFLSVSTAAKEAGYLPQDANVDEMAIQLVGAACSMREISKFQSDKKIFIALANGVLRNFDIQI